MNNLRGAYTIWYRDLLRFWHDKMRMMGSITFPLMFLFVFGSGLSARMGFISPGVDFAQFMFPSIIGMTVLMNSFMAGVSVVWDRDFGFLKEVLVAPISRASVAVGKTLGAATVALLQGIIILLFAPLIGVALAAGTVLALLSLMLLLSATTGSLGIFTGHPNPVYGGISGSDADVNVSYGVPVRSFLPAAGITGVDEHSGQAQSRHLRHRPHPPGDAGVHP